MRSNDLTGFRQAVQLRDRCRNAAVAASWRLEEPMSPVQANIAFDAMVDLIRGGGETPEHEITVRPYSADPELLDWLCSCGLESDSAYAEFGEAAGEGIEHVPADHGLIITRPKESEAPDA